ncbi:MAG: hypothetical protein GC204_12310 [Chloroflexi bacterium]|nr:hypothetical protein [Chloroflexota bacterium]
MGIECTFVQTDDEDWVQAALDWFGYENITLPPDFKPGRTPTYAEVRRALDQMEGYKIEYYVDSDHWEAHFDTPDGVNVWLYSRHWNERSTDDENLIPAEIVWKNTPEVETLPFVKTLANLCGTILIECDCDVGFSYILPNSTK